MDRAKQLECAQDKVRHLKEDLRRAETAVRDLLNVPWPVGTRVRWTEWYTACCRPHRHPPVSGVIVEILPQDACTGDRYQLLLDSGELVENAGQEDLEYAP